LPAARVVGRIQINGDEAGASAQPLGMTRDHAVGQGFAQTIELSRPDGVFKARQGWLRSQIAARDRIAVEQHLVNGVGRQPSRVVGIRIAAGNREDALRQQLAQGVIDLAGLPLVAQASGQSLDQSVTAVRSFQQDGAAIGAAIQLIELQHGGLVENLWEQQTLCRAIVKHAGSLSCTTNTVLTTCL